ncbi:S41 family peptidase [bacterium]|nr:S41 family peptidase [bacterium]
MNRSAIVCLILALPLFRGTAAFGADAPPADREPRRAWGLIVWIDHFADRSLDRTDIEPATIDRLHKTLADTKRFPNLAGRLEMLLSSPGTNAEQFASAANVRRSLERIAKRAEPGDDLLLIWISRHTRGPGETRWLTSDADWNNLPASSLLTGELGELLHMIRCRNRVIVVDSHSARADDPTGPSDPSVLLGPLTEWAGPRRLVVGSNDGYRQDPSKLSAASRIFFTKLTDALAGQADIAGGEPDGWISTTEIIDFLRRQAPFSTVLGYDPNRWIGRNPAPRSKTDVRRAALVSLRDRGELDESTLALGLRLLERLPRFEEDQKLRQAFVALAAGSRSVDELKEQRRQWLGQRQLDDASTVQFSRQASQVYREVLARHVHPEDAPAAMEEGCADLAEAFDVAEEDWVPRAVADILAATPTDPAIPLSAFRSRLGRRPSLTTPAELILLQGMLHALDPYSAYLPRDVFEEIQQQTRSRFTGIGVVLQENPWERTLQVLMPIPGGPADRAGLRDGDRILSVDGAKTIDLGPNEASQRLSGQPGSVVSLDIQPLGAPTRSLTIQREDVPLVTVVGYSLKADQTWNYWIPPALPTGSSIPFRPAYIRITRFAGDTADRLRRVLRDLESQGMTHLILDLRFNPGGLMESACDVADLFLSEGLIMRVMDRQGKNRDRHAVRLGTFRDHQLVVLINGESASGSEIVSAAMADNRRGLVAGSRSFGKGSIQEIVSLPDGMSGLKITSALFLRANGENLERFLGGRRPSGEIWGVRPSIGWEIPLYREEVEKLRGILARQQYLGAGPQSLEGDPTLRRVLTRLSSEPTLVPIEGKSPGLSSDPTKTPAASSN